MTRLKKSGKAHEERLWLLKRWWGWGGWSINPDHVFKKWDKHAQCLLDLGYLEVDLVNPHLYRITNAGRAALAEKATS